MSEFRTFMCLTDFSSANEIVKIFDDAKLDYKTQDTSKDFDPSMSYNSAKDSFLIMLKQQDFEKATALLDEKLKFEINEINTSHPLFSFKIEELKDVLKNHDEWHPLDVKLAKYLLAEKNEYISENEISHIQLQKDIIAKQPEKSDGLTLSMGYFFCMLGGILGIGIAIYLIYGKKTLKDGTKIHAFAKRDRAHGIYMLLLGLLFFFIFVKAYI